jgi:hypothetical protein
VESLEVAGFWWMPGNGDHRVPGILRFSLSSAGTLTLIGGLRRPEDLAEPEQTPDGGTKIVVTQDLIDAAGTYGRLYGECGGKAYTLEGCWQKSSRRGMFGPTYEEVIYVNNVYDGVWFEDGELAEGNALQFTLDGLAEFVAQSGLVAEVNHGAPVGEKWGELRGTGMPEQVANLPNHGQFTLSHHLSMDMPAASASIRESFSIRLEFQEKIFIPDLLETASDLQDLVSIATDRTSQFGKVSVSHPDCHVEHEGKKYDRPFEVWAAWTALRRDDAKPLIRWDLYFNLSDMGGVSGLESWMAIAEKYRSSLGRAMATNYAESMYVSDRFLSRVAALEGVDRIDFGRRKRDFAVRIGRCIEIAGPQFASLIHDPDRWATELKHHRNELAHHYGRRMRQATEEQSYLAAGAYWLMVFFLLRKASVPDDLFDKILTHRKLQFLREKNQSMFA